MSLLMYLAIINLSCMVIIWSFMFAKVLNINLPGHKQAILLVVMTLSCVGGIIVIVALFWRLYRDKRDNDV